MEQAPDAGQQHHHAHHAIDHRGDARQQVHRRTDHRRQLGGRGLGQEHGRHKSHGHADEDGPGGAVDGGEDKGQDAILGVGLVGGVPSGAQQEVAQAHLLDGGQAGDHQIHGDDQHKGHRHRPAQEEQQLHGVLQGV